MEKQKKVEYKISMNFGNETREGKGATVLEALESIEKPVKIVSKTFLKVTDGTRSAETMFTVPRAKRLFYPLAQVYMSKQLELLMR